MEYREGRSVTIGFIDLHIVGDLLKSNFIGLLRSLIGKDEKRMNFAAKEKLKTGS